MSELSYHENVNRGVTGINTNTCYAASLDRISTIAEVSPQTYHDYNMFYRWSRQYTDNEAYANVGDLLKLQRLQIASDVGVNTLNRVIHRRAETAEQLSGMLLDLTSGGFRTILTLNTTYGPHAVGVFPTDTIDEYFLRSTWSPIGEEEPVTTSDIFPYLEQCPRLRKRANCGRKTFKIGNIEAFPGESKA